MATAESALMTAEEFLALPDDGTDRELIEGRLKERPMTVRNRDHSQIMAGVTGPLWAWRRSQPEPRGIVVCGDAGFRLRGSSDSVVGIDVAFTTAEQVAKASADTTLIDGPPLLAVEILSPSDTVDDVADKVQLYLAVGVPHIWLVDPKLKTVTVYRPDADPAIVVGRGELSAEPHLPGFRVAADAIFGG